MWHEVKVIYLFCVVFCIFSVDLGSFQPVFVVELAGGGSSGEHHDLARSRRSVPLRACRLHLLRGERDRGWSGTLLVGMARVSRGADHPGTHRTGASGCRDLRVEGQQAAGWCYRLSDAVSLSHRLELGREVDCRARRYVSEYARRRRRFSFPSYGASPWWTQSEMNANWRICLGERCADALEIANVKGLWSV